MNRVIKLFLFMLVMLTPFLASSQVLKASIEQQRRQRAERILNKSSVSRNSRIQRGTVTQALGTFAVQQADEITNPLQNIIQSLVGPGVTVSNIQTNLPATSNIYGSFSGGYDVIGIDQGLLMTSGSVFNALGPNTLPWTSQDNGLPGYLPMDSAGFDASIISFNVVSSTNNLTFKYVFASEEYNEYVGSVFNDQFAFFITGPGFPNPTNIAMIPGTNTNVAINNVNLGLNPLHYINNDSAFNSNPLRFQTLEYDGLTKVFTTAAITVVPGQEYTLTLVIQDVSDGVYDSGVFIQGGSISSDSCVMSLQVEKTDITCHGLHDGSIEVDYNGASGPVSLLWSTGDTTREIEHLGPGTYTVTATDGSGCHATLPYPVVLADPDPVTVQPLVTGTTCSGGTTGSVDLLVTAGFSPFTFTLDTLTANTGFFDGLNAGMYSYSVTDAHQCNTAGTVVIPSSVSLSVTPASGISETGVEQCFDVLVTDGSSNPVPGMSVDVTTGPVNVQSGTVISDVNGVAHFCYIGLQTGIDQVTATACGANASATFSWTQPTLPIAFEVTGGGIYCTNASIQGLEIGLAGSQQNTTYQLRFDSAGGSANIGMPVWGTGSAISFGIQQAHMATGSFSVLATNQSSMQSLPMLNSVVVKKAAVAKPAKPAKVFGTTDACPYVGEGTVTYYIKPVLNATSYEWSFKQGTAAHFIGNVSDTLVTVSFDESFTKDTLMVRAVNNCGTVPVYSAYTTLVVSRLLAATPPSISGPANPCIYSSGSSLATYSITPAAYASEYVWKVPAGARIMGSSSQPLFGTPVTDSLVTDDLEIYVSWESVFSTSNLTLSVSSLNNCSRSVARTKTIHFLYPATPSTITASPAGTNVCPLVGTASEVSYSIRKVTYANEYSWKVPAGALIVGHGTTTLAVPVSAPDSLVTEDTLIRVRYAEAPPAGSYIRVAAANECWQSANRSLAVKATLPSAPSVVSGLLNVCSKIGSPAPGDTIRYSVVTPYLTGATSYRWTVSNPATMQVVDAGTDSTWIAVRFVFGSFVSGSISVRSVSGCGTSTSARTLAISTTAVAAPASISGLANVCSKIGQASPLDTARYTAAAVAGAANYRWVLTAPSGNALIVDAANDSSWIAIRYTFGFTGGTISVRSVSSCGVASSSARSLTLSVTKPSTPSSITGPTDLCAYIGLPVDATYMATAVSGAVAYSWTLPAGAQIVSGSGTRTITVHFDSFSDPDSISVQAVGACALGAKRSLLLSASCNSNQYARLVPAIVASEARSTGVYPNPNNGSFTFTIQAAPEQAFTLVRIIDMYGHVLSVQKIFLNSGKAMQRITVPHAVPGLYQLVYTTGNETRSERFMIVR